MEPHERYILLGMHNPVRGFLHGSAAVASFFGGLLLWQRASEPWRQGVLLVFALSMVGLYTVSSLYHSVPWSQRTKARMQRLDHSMIYFLIAGSYTPIASVALDGTPLAILLTIVWAIAIIGTIQKLFFPKVSPRWSVAFQTIQGWLALPLLGPMAERLPFAAIELLVAGGIIYTIGMICFVTQRPRLWPRVFSYHECFHICVIVGSAAHFAVAFWYVA